MKGNEQLGQQDCHRNRNYLSMKIAFILQSDFPKDSDMVESFECQQTQTNRCVKKAKKKLYLITCKYQCRE